MLIASRDITPTRPSPAAPEGRTSAQVTGTPLFGGRPPSPSKANQRPLAQPQLGWESLEFTKHSPFL